MKMSILFFMFCLTLHFGLSAATEMQKGERGCNTIGEKCGSDKPCCYGFQCSPIWDACIYSTPSRR
uniref:U17-Theraphotoxin-Ct1a_1 n=1 Tax=Coremiocnemis tropix TaxID=1904443 RepID=A0A482ZA31_CORTR